MSKVKPKKIIGSVDFEVYGKVQRVYFRKHTQARGKQLGLKGWCQNTPQGTVVGTLEGDPDKIETMKMWLESIGSPNSSITKAEFRNEKFVDGHKYTDFKIIK